MPIDVKDVDLAVREIVRPALRKAGFTHFERRTSWRYTADAIDIVNVRSFGNWLAQGMSISTFSFCVDMGTWLPYVPSEYGSMSPKYRNGRIIPREVDCCFRFGLDTGIAFGIRDRVWSIAYSGVNLDRSVKDALEHIVVHGLPWFARLATPEKAMQVVEAERAQNRPVSLYQAGYIAKQLGLHVKARQYFLEASASGCWKYLQAQLDADIALVS